MRGRFHHLPSRHALAGQRGAGGEEQRRGRPRRSDLTGSRPDPARGRSPSPPAGEVRRLPQQLVVVAVGGREPPSSAAGAAGAGAVGAPWPRHGERQDQERRRDADRPAQGCGGAGPGCAARRIAAIVASSAASPLLGRAAVDLVDLLVGELPHRRLPLLQRAAAALALGEVPRQRLGLSRGRSGQARRAPRRSGGVPIVSFMSSIVVPLGLKVREPLADLVRGPKQVRLDRAGVEPGRAPRSPGSTSPRSAS